MKAVFKTGYLIVIAAISLIIGSCGEQKTAARVGNHVITMDEVVKAVSAGNRSANTPLTYSAMMTKVNELVDNELAVIDAYRLKLDQSPVITDQVAVFQDGRVYLQVISKHVIGKVVPEELVKEKYDQQSREFHARHIFFGKKAGEIQPSDREQVNRLRSQILRNADFDALARQFSKDSLSAGKGGDLGFIKWGDRKWGDEFYRTLSSLQPGQVSQVVESDRGIHLIKLEQVRELEQPPFEIQKEELQKSFFREKNKLLDSTFYAFVDQMKKRYKVRYPENAVDSLLSLFSKAQNKQINLQNEPVRFLDSLTAAQRAMPLAIYTGGVFNVESAVKVYERISPRRRPLLNSTKEIDTFISRNVPRVLLIKYGYEKGYQRKEAVRQEVAAEKKRLLAEESRKVNILDKLVLSDQDVEAFYRENRHLFETGAQINVQEILIKDEVKANEIYARAVGGEDFSQLTIANNERAETRNQEGRLGWLSDKTKGAVAKAAARMKAGDISKPIKVAEGFSVIKALERQSGVLDDFSKNANRAKRELRNFRRDQLQQQWMDGLKASVAVVINESEIRKEAGLAEN